jgi:hypothetical protein
MGYYTHYKFTRVQGLHIDDFWKAFDEHSIASDGYTRRLLASGEAVTWYEHEQHITDAMLKTETLAVDLHGKGEEQGDVWDKEFRLVTVQGEGEHVEIKEYRYELRRPDTPTEERRLR